jgi:hypothetical protein
MNPNEPTHREYAAAWHAAGELLRRAAASPRLEDGDDTSPEQMERARRALIDVAGECEKQARAKRAGK